MKLIDAKDVPEHRIVATFKSSPIGPAIMMIPCMMIPVMPWLFLLDWLDDDSPWVRAIAIAIGIVATLVFGLIWWAVEAGLWHYVRATFWPSNWIMKVGRDAVYVKYRSYANAHFPDDVPIVAEVSFDEIVTAGKMVEWVRTTSLGGTPQSKRNCWLELQLDHADTDELAELIKAERGRRVPYGRFSGGRHHHVPVLVPGPGVVWTEWRGGRMLKALAGHVEIVETRRRSLDTRSASTEQADEMILALIERGDTIGAVRLVRRTYGMGLTQAKQFVDDLTGGDQRPPSEH